MPETVISDARAVFALAAAIYALGFAFGLGALLTRRRYPRPVMLAILAVAFAVQTAGLYIRGGAIQACPLGNLFEIAQFIAWSLVLFFFVIGPAFNLGLLGFFTACAAATFSGVPFFFPGLDAPYPPGLFGGNPWIEFHVSLAIFSYGIFALVALVSIMFLVQDHGLRHKRLNGVYTFLPSVQQLDLMGCRLLVVGLVSFSIAIGIGVFSWMREPWLVPAYKLAAAGVVWLGYLAVAILRQQKRLVTRRHAVAAILLFFAALFTLWPVQNARTAPEPPQEAPVSGRPHE